MYVCMYVCMYVYIVAIVTGLVSEFVVRPSDMISDHVIRTRLVSSQMKDPS